MIDTNRTGPNAGRYLFMPFEAGSAGVQRVDLWDSNYSTRTVTIVAPGTNGFTSGDASRWTPWGGYLTAEESWGTGSSKGRLFEVTNRPRPWPMAAASSSARSSRVSHEGLAFDANKALYFVDERSTAARSTNTSPTTPTPPTATTTSPRARALCCASAPVARTEGTSARQRRRVVVDRHHQQHRRRHCHLHRERVTAPSTTAADHASIKEHRPTAPRDLEIQTVGGTQRLYFTTTDSGSFKRRHQPRLQPIWPPVR